MSREATSGVSRRLELAIQLITGLAVVIGAILVIFELQQSRSATYAQMVQDRVEFSKAHYSQMYGEKLSAVLSKACYKPQQLDGEDILIMDRYIKNIIQEIYKARALQEVGQFGVVSGGVSWKNAVGRYMLDILSYPSGRAFLKKHPYFSNPKFAPSDSVVEYVQTFDSELTYDCRDASDWLIPSI